MDLPSRPLMEPRAWRFRFRISIPSSVSAVALSRTGCDEYLRRSPFCMVWEPLMAEVYLAGATTDSGDPDILVARQIRALIAVGDEHRHR